MCIYNIVMFWFKKRFEKQYFSSTIDYLEMTDRPLGRFLVQQVVLDVYASIVFQDNYILDTDKLLLVLITYSSINDSLLELHQFASQEMDFFVYVQSLTAHCMPTFALKRPCSESYNQKNYFKC